MEQELKQRLTGAAIIVIVAVIFIPMVLDFSVDDMQHMRETNIPAQPADMPAPPPVEDFSSRIIPLEQLPEELARTEAPAAPEAGDTEHPIDAAPKSALPEETAVNEQIIAPEVAKETATVAVKEASSTSVGVTAWVVQLGSFSSAENAEALNQKLRKAGFKAFVEPLKQDSGTVYRVRIGPELKQSNAEAIKANLKKSLKLDGIVVRYP